MKSQKFMEVAVGVLCISIAVFLNILVLRGIMALLVVLYTWLKMMTIWSSLS